MSEGAQGTTPNTGGGDVQPGTEGGGEQGDPRTEGGGGGDTSGSNSSGYGAQAVIGEGGAVSPGIPPDEQA